MQSSDVTPATPGQAPAPAPAKSNRTLIIIIVVVVAILLLCCCAILGANFVLPRILELIEQASYGM